MRSANILSILAEGYVETGMIGLSHDLAKRQKPHLYGAAFMGVFDGSIGERPCVPPMDDIE